MNRKHLHVQQHDKQGLSSHAFLQLNVLTVHAPYVQKDGGIADTETELMELC
jgi:hypothetical protein